MKYTGITKEELYLLVRMKKRRRMYITLCFVLLCLILCGISVSVVYFNKSDKEGSEINTQVVADIGVSDCLELKDYSEAIQTASDAVDEIDSTEITISGDSLDNFVVPETSLPPVEEVVANNWYDESYFKKNEDVPVMMEYFTNSVFIGDSRAEGLIIYSGISNLNGFCYKGLNVGKLDQDRKIVIPGETSSYTCYEAIENSSYNNYYCLFGVNELGWIDYDEFIVDFSNLIDKIYSVNPDAVVYVCSIIPVTKELSDGDDIYNITNVNTMNELLLEMCKTRKDVVYLDIAATVTDEDGYLPAEATIDGVHCNSPYCKRLIQYIRYNNYIRVN